MKTIGITGGVGSGKSEVLKYLKNEYNSRILIADEAAHLLQEKGQSCYAKLVALLGSEVLTPNGEIEKQKMADLIFQDEELLKKVNALIHPSVIQFIIDEINRERKYGILDFFFVEAALLIENGFDVIVDEMWYIYTEESVRRKRLRDSRSYTDEKTTGIMARQLPEEAFRKACRVVIDNSGNFEDTKKQIDQKLGEYLWQK